MRNLFSAMHTLDITTKFIWSLNVGIVDVLSLECSSIKRKKNWHQENFLTFRLLKFSAKASGYQTPALLI